jgi:tetratricopeptide (TPR) repeat protein
MGLAVLLAAPAAQADEAELLAAYKAADYRDTDKLHDLFFRFAADINARGKQASTEELLYATDMASCLWNVTQAPDEQKKVAELGVKMAQVLLERDAKSVDATYLMGLNLLLYAQSKGVLDTLFALQKVKGYMEAARELNPRYLYSSPSIGLGALYMFAPGFPVAFGDSEKAGKYFLEAAKAEPRQTTPWLLLGAVYAKQGDAARSLESFKKVRKVAPWTNPATMIEKDMDFWWYADQIRAVRAIRVLEGGQADVRQAFAIVDSASRDITDKYLPRALQAELAR